MRLQKSGTKQVANITDLLALPKRLLRFGFCLFTVFSVIVTATYSPSVFAQEACSPERLKNLQVAILNCSGSSSSPCSSSGVLNGADNAEKVYSFLIGKGLTPAQAAGVMGNLQVESGYKADNQQDGSTFPSGGWGIAQWTNPGRRDALVAALQAAGLPYTNEQTPPDKLDALLAFELDYLYKESVGRRSRTFPGTSEWDGLKRQTTAREAAYYWEFNFERPKVAGQEERLKAADEILAKYGGSTVAASSGASACSSGNTDGASEGQDTSALQCPAGTTDAGVEQDYGPGRVPTVKIRLCNLPTITQVNASIAPAVLSMVSDLESVGLKLSGDAWRSYDEQAGLRSTNGCPDVDTSPSGSCRVPTARPGTGTHEVGLAIDFNNMCYPSSVCPGSASWRWLTENASRYGFKKNSREAWHWSPNGG